MQNFGTLAHLFKIHPNFKLHVASDIAIGQSYLPSSKIQSQSYMDSIQQWTNGYKMRVNGKKTKFMKVNLTQNSQMATRIHFEGELLEIVNETNLLGCVITSDMKFKNNTYGEKGLYQDDTIA